MAGRHTRALVMLALGLCIALGACRHDDQNAQDATAPAATVPVATVEPTAPAAEEADAEAPPTAEPAATATPTSTPVPEAGGSPCYGGDASHAGAVAGAVADALEPKWVALASQDEAWLPYSPLVADDRMVVASVAPRGQLYAPWTNLSARNYRPAAADREAYALYAFSLADGRQLWRFATGGVVVGAPQIAGGRAYAAVWNAPGGDQAEGSSTVYCLDGAGGRLLWRHDVPDSRAGMPVVAEGVLVLPGHETAVVTALDAETGAPLWTAPLGEPDGSLVPPTLLDGRVYLSDGRRLYGLEARTGAPLWTLESDSEPAFGGVIGARLLGPIVAAEGRLYWADQATLYAAEAGTGRVIWRSAEGAAFKSGPSYREGRLYIAGSWDAGEGLMAVDASDGRELWRQDGPIIQHLEAYPRHWSLPYAPLITGNGRVVSGAGLLDAGDGRVIWSFADVHPALPWNARFAGRTNYPAQEAWLPAQWADDQSGAPVLVPSFQPWLGPPAVSGGLVIGWGGCAISAIGGCEGYRLVAYGADTTPPIAVIDPRDPPPSGTWNWGTAYDYNLVDWTLSLGGDGGAAARELAHRSVQIQSELFYRPANLGTLADGAWALQLTVNDAAGHTAAATQEFTVDRTGPVVAITAPRSGETVIHTGFTLSGTAKDAGEIARVRVSADGGRSWQEAQGTTAWSLPLTVTEAMVGKDIPYIADAVDAHGNASRSAPATLSFPFFELALGENGRLLSSSLSMFIDPATDIDGDGIDQRWENAVIAHTMPVLELDEEEQWLDRFLDPFHAPYAMNYFVRVTGYTPPDLADALEGERPMYILVYIAFGWAKDWGALGLGVMDYLEAHRGDSETVTMAWRVTGERGAELEWVRTSAHGGPSRHHGLWHVWERSCTLANVALTFDDVWDTELMCAELEFDRDGRLVLYPGEDKHAVYPSTAVCEDVTLHVSGDGETCGWDPLLAPVIDVPLPGQWTDSYFDDDPRYQGGGRWLFDAYNVGEPDPCRRYQLIDFLDSPETWRGLTDAQVDALTGQYPSESIWSGTANDPARWDESATCTLPGCDPNVSCTLLLDGDGAPAGGHGFCGGLEDTIDEPEKSTSKPGSNLGQAGDWTDAGPADMLVEVLNARYEVEITTGDRDRAGTDALIHVGLVIDGDLRGGMLVLSQGSTQAYAPPVVNAGTFERGDADRVYLWEEGGEVSAIRLTHDNAGGGPEWFVERVVVRDRVTGRAWAAWPQLWLAADRAPYSTTATIPLQPYQPGTISELTYDVMVRTGDRSGAGTNANVSLTLLWEDGVESGPFALDKADHDDFERNASEWYTLSAQDRGALSAIRLAVDRSGGDDAWYCQEVSLRNTITGETWTAPVNAWLGRTADTLAVERPVEE